MPPNKNLYDDLSVPDLVTLARKRSDELCADSQFEREGGWAVTPELIKDSMLFKRLAEVLKTK